MKILEGVPAVDLKKKMTTVRKTSFVKPIMVITTRRQTPEEENQFNAALEALVREMVRQELDKAGGSE